MVRIRHLIWIWISPKFNTSTSPNPSSSHYINVPSNLTRPSSQSNTKCTRETITPPRQRFTLPSSYPRRRRTPSKTSWFETYPPKSVIWIRNRDDSPEEGRRKLAGQLIARESRARARIVCEDNHCETLQANIDAACYRNNGQTRRDNAMPRAYITLVPVFGQLHACATLHCARDSRERERERGGRAIILDFWKECFSPPGRKGFRGGCSRPLDGRLSQPKWDSRVVGQSFVLLLARGLGHTSEGKFVCSRDACNRLQLCVDRLWRLVMASRVAGG